MIPSLVVALVAVAQGSAAPTAAPPASRPIAPPVAAPAARASNAPAVAGPAGAPNVDEAIAGSVEELLTMQEVGATRIGATDGPAEWPYEGVYRVAGQIPIGYRVGGTSIVAMALMTAPGYEKDARRQAAVANACRFVCAAADDPLMNPDYDGGYDVRGWGHSYGLQFLLRLAATNAIPEGQADEVGKRTKQYLAALQQVEIPQVGGWNYARAPQRQPSPASPFMTAPALQTLFEAKRQGLPVDDAVVERGLAALERCRTQSGAFAYSAKADATNAKDGTPGAVGRMLVSETTLLLAGRSDIAKVRGALDAFIAHWDRLEERRAKDGTHKPPFNVAPYYFYYAHLAAAQAIELLPPHERPEYRRKFLELLFRTRGDDGRWNDRVFPRTANYGTSCAVMSLCAPQATPPTKWTGGGAIGAAEGPGGRDAEAATQGKQARP
jgi:hypothetical protein